MHATTQILQGLERCLRKAIASLSIISKAKANLMPLNVGTECTRHNFLKQKTRLRSIIIEVPRVHLASPEKDQESIDIPGLILMVQQCHTFFDSQRVLKFEPRISCPQFLKGALSFRLRIMEVLSIFIVIGCTGGNFLKPIGGNFLK